MSETYRDSVRAPPKMGSDRLLGKDEAKRQVICGLDCAIAGVASAPAAATAPAPVAPALRMNERRSIKLLPSRTKLEQRAQRAEEPKSGQYTPKASCPAQGGALVFRRGATLVEDGADRKST